jgi:hypothetical protein
MLYKAYNECKKKGVLFLCLAVLMGFVVISCPQLLDDDAGETGGGAWTPAATLFKLEGETGVTNVKLTWIARSDSNAYEVFRDGVSIGKAAGDTMDDYGLVSGASYSYTVKAYNAGFNRSDLKAVSAAVTVTPFTPAAGALQVFDNTVQSNPDMSGDGTPQPGGFEFGGTWYGYQTQTDGDDVIVRERTSPDGLNNWTQWRTLDTKITGIEGQTGAKLEGSGFRKVGNKVVLSGHHEPKEGYSLGHFFLGSITPGGDMEITFDDRPFGNESRDQSIFTDTDGKIYVLGSTLTDIGIYRLDEDYTEPVEFLGLFFQDQRRETPSIIHVGNTYYFFSSSQSGWYPSQAAYATASNIGGPWSSLREIGNSATFGSQYNSVKEQGTLRQTYALYAYRWAAQWSHSETEGDRKMLMTLSLSGGECAAAEFFSKVEYYPDYGLVGVQPGRNLSRGMHAISVPSGAANPGKITDGADMAGSGYFTGGSTFPYSVVIDLKNPAVLKEAHTTVRMVGGSEGAFQYVIAGSADNSNWTTLVDQPSNWRPGFLLDKITDAGQYRYVKLTVNGIINVNNNNSATWADGIIELAVFGAPAD